MTPTEFAEWRKSLDLSQKGAADALGVSRGTVQMYENGHRKGDPSRRVVIPKPIRLACAAIKSGFIDFPAAPPAEIPPPARRRGGRPRLRPIPETAEPVEALF